jgi:hypothetical protein
MIPPDLLKRHGVDPRRSFQTSSIQQVVRITRMVATRENDAKIHVGAEMKHEQFNQQDSETLLRTIDARFDRVNKATRIIVPVLALVLFSVLGVVVYLTTLP